MIFLSIARLPTRWRLASAVRRRVECASLTTTSAAAASTHSPTKRQWRTTAAALGVPPGHRSFSQTAQMQTDATPDKEFEEELEKLEQERRAKEARKGQKRKEQKRAEQEALRRPECEAFGPFEDIIQPVALTLWGGKAKEMQGPPKLTYQAEFLGPTFFYRLKIYVRKPETEETLWRVLWRQTRPDFYQMRMAARNDPKLQKALQAKVKPVQTKREDSKDSPSLKTAMETLETKAAPYYQVLAETPPPLDAVVQDIFKRGLARGAPERAINETAEQTKKQIAWAMNSAIPAKKKLVEKWLQKLAELKAPASLDQHSSRPPFNSRKKLRHFDICGPLPMDVLPKKAKPEMNYVWNETAGNTLVNHFEQTSIGRSALGNGITIILSRGVLETKEMERLVTKPSVKYHARVEKEIETRARAANQVTPSKEMKLRAKEHIKQIQRKMDILTKQCDGWRLILHTVALKLWGKIPTAWCKVDGECMAFEEESHPDRETIEGVWNPRLAALRDPAAVENYEAFIRMRMAAGEVPAEMSAAAFMEAQVLRGYQARNRRRPHPGELAKLERRDAADDPAGVTIQLPQNYVRRVQEKPDGEGSSSPMTDFERLMEEKIVTQRRKAKERALLREKAQDEKRRNRMKTAMMKAERDIKKAMERAAKHRAKAGSGEAEAVVKDESYMDRVTEQAEFYLRKYRNRATVTWKPSE